MNSSTIRGFTCKSGEQTCVAQLTSATVATVTCESGTSAHFSHLTIPFAVELTDTASIISTFVMYAPLFQLNYQSSDLPPSPTTTSSSRTGNNIATTRSSSSGGGGATLASSVPVQGPSPVGTLIGIGVGVAGGVVVLALIGFWVIRARRIRRLAASVANQGVKQLPPVELGGGGHTMAFEMPADAKT